MTTTSFSVATTTSAAESNDNDDDNLIFDWLIIAAIAVVFTLVPVGVFKLLLPKFPVMSSFKFKLAMVALDLTVLGLAVFLATFSDIPDLGQDVALGVAMACSINILLLSSLCGKCDPNGRGRRDDTESAVESAASEDLPPDYESSKLELPSYDQALHL